MFQYTIPLDVWFSGQRPEITDMHVADFPVGAHLTITLGHDVNINLNGGQMSLPAGSQVTGTIIAKQLMP